MTVAVLGGGISGLTAAYYFHFFGVKSRILVLEGSNHLGGWINSLKTKNGTLFELGPRTLRVPGNAGANTLHLVQSLKLEEKIRPISSDHVSAKNRMIKVNNKLHKLPNSVKSTFTKLAPFSRPLIFHLLRDLITPAVHSNDESFYSFAQRRFGTEVAKYAVDPLCRGVFAGNAKDLSAMALTKRLYKVEQHYNSVIKGFIFGRKFKEIEDLSLRCALTKRAKREKWSVWSFEGGLQTLVNAIEEQLHRGSIDLRKETNILEIRPEGNKMLIITDKENFTADRVVSCLPASNLKNVVKKWNPNLYSLLNDIPFVSVGLVNLEYEENIVTEPAFGYLVPSTEPSKVLGVIYDTCIFPQGDKTVFTVMMGGYWFKELFGDHPSPEVLLDIAVNEIRTTFNTNAAEPTNYKVSILKNCIPQYTVGHFERVANARKLLSKTNLFLAGNSYDGVGVNDAIYNTKKIVSAIL